MKKLYFLGLAAGVKNPIRRVFTRGGAGEITALESALGKRYGGAALAVKNGRTALALALRTYLDRGDKILVNGFTCHAVIEAIRAAGMKPVYADIDAETLNFTAKTLEKAYVEGVTGVIVQNTLGIPVPMEEIERFARKRGLVIIEDLAHAVGVKYSDGREAGTTGAATVLSFGKDKAIDATSGGAVVFREQKKYTVTAPEIAPKASDRLRARFYPLIGLICRKLTRVRLGGALMRCLVRIRCVERSADNKLDLKRGIAGFQAKLALKQLQERQAPQGQLREFYLVRNREEVLEKLKAAGYYFDGFWYERPISPERCYKATHFPEKDCPVAVKVAKTIINLPNYYTDEELKPARGIIKPYIVREGKL